MRPPASVLILGGGIGGLRVANLLAEQGVKVQLLEKLDETGGLSRSFDRGGFQLDIGPHAYYAGQAPLYKDWIGAENILDVRGIYGVGYKRRQITTPINPTNLIKNLPVTDAAALALDMAFRKTLGKLTAKPEPEHFESVDQLIQARFGEKVTQFFFRDYIPKVTGLSARAVHEDWFLERDRFYKEHNLWANLLKTLLKIVKPVTTDGATGQHGQLQFLYPKRGAGQIIQGLTSKVRSQGVDIRLGYSVTSVEPHGDGPVTVKATNAEGVEETFEADAVASTIPVTALAKGLRPLDTELVGATSGLRYSALRMFYFILDRPRLSDKIQIYFPEKKYLFKRIYETRNLNPDMGSAGRTAISVEVCINPGDANDQLPAEAIQERLIGELGDFYGVGRGEVVDWFTHRVTECYSVYANDYRKNIDPLVKRLFAEDRVVAYGRTGAFRYNFLSDRVLAASAKVAEYLLSGRPKQEVLGQPDPKNPFL